VPTPAAAIVKMRTCIDRTDHGRRVQVEALERTSCAMAKATYSKLARSFTDIGWGWPRTLKVRMPGTHKTYRMIRYGLVGSLVDNWLSTQYAARQGPNRLPVPNASVGIYIEF
jgi:hypothetical protein